MTLRPYQKEAVDAAVTFMRQSVDPFLIDAATGAGKSHIIAEVARCIHEHTSKRILCLAPSAELVTQNREKYLASGHPASMFSASAGAKELRHPVVFGSPLTVKNKISRFCKQGREGYALVIVDECHGITPTLQYIIERMKEANPRLRVMGLTATPYRLGTGYIFREWPAGRVNDQGQAKDPYFQKCVYQIGAPMLIDAGYLTPPRIGEINADRYDTSGLVADARGKFDAAEVDRAYHGHGRKTAAIVADVIEKSRGRKGVMFFAATVQHAEEVLASLPPEMSALVTGETPKAQRKSILKRFKAQQIKYIVNVAVLTTGFDAPHVDVIAMLRKTESVGLLQQIIGRGLRLDDDKTDCLVLDYTTNIEDHCPDGDLFAPVIRVTKRDSEAAPVKAECELCGYVNEFTIRPEVAEAGYKIDEQGYCLDLDGHRVETEEGPLPAHFGRRCWGQVRAGPNGEHVRCEYRWTGKECPNCYEPNDIAARYCVSCKGEIVDPNEKLRGEWRAFKKNPGNLQTDKVLSMKTRPGVSQKGNKTLRVDFTTEWRSFSIWLLPDATHTRGIRDMQAFRVATEGGDPATVTYKKEPNGFYRVYAYNQNADVEPQTEDA